MALHEVVKITGAARFDGLGNIEATRVVTWKVGKHGPFTYETPAAGFSADAVSTELERQAQEILKLVPPA